MRGSTRAEDMSASTPALIGRSAEIDTFCRALDGTLSQRIVGLSGFGGVGKSTLLEYLIELAEGSHAPVALVNARQLAAPAGQPIYGPVIDTLIALAGSLPEHGGRAEALTGRLQRYRRLHRQVTDKFADQSAAVASILRVGFTAVRSGATLLPFGRAVDVLFNQDLVNDVSKAIAGHRKESDRALLVQPVEELTTCLIDDLRAMASAARRPVVLCFDEYELMHPEIDAWLRRLFTHSLGQADRVALLVVAGRMPLGQDWTARGRAGDPRDIINLTLTEFSHAEVVQYLCRFVDGLAVDVAERVADRLGEPCRLPLVLRLLVAERADMAALADSSARVELGLLANSLIDRLFDSPGSPEAGRDAALAASVARSFDLPLLEVILAVAGIADARTYFDWLERQHFVNPRAPAFTFYDMVREIFISRLRAANPNLLERIQRRLAEHFDAAAGADSGDRSRQRAIEATYHRLSAARSGVVPVALNAVMAALPNAFALAMDWSRMLGQVAEERKDLGRDDAEGLHRLSRLVARSWRLGSAAGADDVRPGSDLARNIFLTSFYDGERPTVDDSDADRWLSYLECRLRMAIGGDSELGGAESSLTAILVDSRVVRGGNASPLLLFCVYLDLAGITARRGDLADAIAWCGKAMGLARAQASPLRLAVALYHLSTNQKRLGSYRDALRNLDEAITLVSGDSQHVTRYYLGRLLLDKANTHTYLNETRQAEEMFEAARSQFRSLSPQSHAEVSHRIGWLKRIRGELDDSLSDHRQAVGRFRELEADLLAHNSLESSSIVLLRAKASHSMGNVLSEMCRHEEAMAAFDEAIGIFSQRDARRHVAIALKDRAWSRTQTVGALAAEDDLLRAVAILEDNADDRAHATGNLATHLAEAWLQLAMVRALSGRRMLAVTALASADKVVGNAPDNQALRAGMLLIGGLLAALDRRPEAVEAPLREVESYARAVRPSLWALSAKAAMVRGIAATLSDQPGQAERWLAEAESRAARWNRYAPAMIEEMVTLLRRSPGAGAVARIGTAGQGGLAIDATATLAVAAGLSPPSRDRAGASTPAGELIDIYDATRRPIGMATSNLAHLAGLWHRTFHCWIGGRSSDHEKVVVLQQRGPYKRDYANFLDISAAGHYHATEKVEGGLREIQEELGLTVAAEELRLVARRTIDERLANGIINREFQDIFLLERAVDPGEFVPSYPEVAAVYYCDLGALRGLVAGDEARVSCRGIAVTPDERRIVGVEKTATLADFIPSARHYLGAVLSLLDQHLDRAGGTAGRGHREPTGGGVYLPDGSWWNPL